MESLVAFVMLAAVVSAFRAKAKLATLLFALGVAGVLILLGFHATSHLKLLF